MIFAVFSDIHANLTALEAVYEHFLKLKINADIVILGDYIDYGARPNETTEYIKKMSPKIVLCGNHEKAIGGTEYNKFSSQRGIDSSKLLGKLLNESSIKFIEEHQHSFFEINENILFIHGDLQDPSWGRMPYTEMQDRKYAKYDFVISGHTHVPHLMEMFYESGNTILRNRKKTIFANPGSVGQPRNNNPFAQYMVINTVTEECKFYKVQYDVVKEQSFFTEEFDDFYKKRLTFGI
jgi:putative phosphoesterase